MATFNALRAHRPGGASLTAATAVLALACGVYLSFGATSANAADTALTTATALAWHGSTPAVQFVVCTASSPGRPAMSTL